MEPKNIKIENEIDDRTLCEMAITENEQMADKIEVQEAFIAKQEVEIKNQQDRIKGLEKRVKDYPEGYERLSFDNEILKAKMEVVRMIFGGRGNE